MGPQPQQAIAASEADGAAAFPMLAVPAPWQSFPERFEWAAENGFALTYAPNPDAPHLIPQHVGPFVRSGVPVRYHGFFPGCEIGDQNTLSAERAVSIHKHAMEAICGHGEPVITFHIGLDPGIPIDPDRAMENLGRLVEYGKRLGITVCTENLRRGVSSHPEVIRRWAETTGSGITFDIGHASGSERVLRGELSLDEFADSFGAHLMEVHFYEKETDRHYPPRDMVLLGPIVNRLLGTSCRWWTIELLDGTEALDTRALLLNYLKGV